MPVDEPAREDEQERGHDVRGSRRQGRHAPVHARRGGEEQGAPFAPPPPAPTAVAPSSTGASTAAAVDERPLPTAAPLAATHKLSGRALVRGVTRRDRTAMIGGAKLRLVVLACTKEDTTAIDIASGALVRLRVPWPAGHEPDLAPFDVVEAVLADDPERDDLAQPEAVTPAGLPRHVGTLRGRRVRHMLQRLAAPPDGPLLGFPGPSAPYWEFRGLRPSVALVKAARDPQLLRRPADGSTWVRFGWERDDVWLPVEDRRALRALDASRADRLSGKALATALGFTPQYLVAAVSRPREGHCYKLCTALLPKE